MPTYKGTKKIELRKKSLKNTISPQTLVAPSYPTYPTYPQSQPPPYSVLPIDYLKLELLNPSRIQLSPISPISQLNQEQISHRLLLNSGMKTNVMKVADSINLIFDAITGTIKEINTIRNDDTDNGYQPQIYDLPLPNEIKWLNKRHIIAKSTTKIGTILALNTEDKIDGTTSFIIFEKVSFNDNFDIKVMLNLKYNDKYITNSEILDIIYVNMNMFWVVLNQDDEIHLVYYYKSKEDLIKKKITSKYSHTNIIVKDIEDYTFINKFTFICTMWSLYDITPSIIYLLVHDENKKVLILEYVIDMVANILPNDIHTTTISKPNINLYNISLKLYDCGEYISFCANYNISIFSVLLKLENNDKCFYTGIMALTQPNEERKSNITLEFSQNTTFPKNVSDIEAQLLIYNIIEKTELSIMKEEQINEQDFLKKKRDHMANKELENAKKELDRRDKEASELADKLLAEDELAKSKTKNKHQILKQKVSI